MPFLRSAGPNLTADLRKGIITPEIVTVIEEQTRTYFSFSRREYGGLFASFELSDQSPIKLLHQPKERERHPEVQAIAQIGAQFYYWRALRHVVTKADFDSSRPKAMFLIPAYFGKRESDDIILEINRLDYSTKYWIQEIAKERGHASPRYDALIRTLNLGGSLSFWGVYKNSLFEIEVENADGGNVYVPNQVLGLTNELLDMTWQTQKDTFSAFESLYASVLEDLLQNGQIPQEITTINVLVEAIKRGKIRNFGDFNSTLLNAGIVDEEIIPEIMEMMNNPIKQRLIEEGDSNPFIRSLDLLVQYLRKMYDVARIYCHTRGLYPFDPHKTEEFIIYPS